VECPFKRSVSSQPKNIHLGIFSVGRKKALNDSDWNWTRSSGDWKMGVSVCGGEGDKSTSTSFPVGKGSSPSGPVTKLREEEDAEEENEDVNLRRGSRVSPSTFSHSPRSDAQSAQRRSHDDLLHLHPHLVWCNGNPPHLLRTEDGGALYCGCDGGGARGKINNGTIPTSSVLFSTTQDPTHSPTASLPPSSSSPPLDIQGKGEHEQATPKSNHQQLPPPPPSSSTSCNWNCSYTTTTTSPHNAKTNGNANSSCSELDGNILSLYSLHHEYADGFEYGLPSPTPPPRSLNILTLNSTTTLSSTAGIDGTNGKWSRRRLRLRLEMEPPPPPTSSSSLPVPSSVVIPIKATDQVHQVPTSTIGTHPPTTTGNGETVTTAWRSRSGSVTLPVPSPPSASILHSPFPYSKESSAEEILDMDSPRPRTRSTRRLISTEAQTEESSLDGLAPPPPPLRNREQRKRERRERRQNRERQQQNLPPSTSSSPEHGSGNWARNRNSGQQLQIQPGSNSNDPVPDGPSGSGLQAGLSELMNLRVPIPPPPYSTLPPPEQSRPSRVTPDHNTNPVPAFPLPSSSPSAGTVPRSLDEMHPGGTRRERRADGETIGPVGQLNSSLNPPPPNCLPSPTQPLRYHFSPPQNAQHTPHIPTHTRR